MIQQYMKLHFIYEEYIIRFYNVLCGELLIMHDYNVYIYSVSVDILELFVDTSKYVKTQQVAANKVL